jgi:hypothetical protein
MRGNEKSMIRRSGAVVTAALWKRELVNGDTLELRLLVN